MALNDEINKLLSEFGLSLVNDTRSNLQKKLDERASRYGGKKVKSRLWASIENKLTYNSEGVKLEFKMNDYWDVVDGGRKASNVSSEGQKKIAEWSATRGLAEKIRLSDLQARLERAKTKKPLKKMPFERAKKAAGFLVARALKKKKLEPTNFFTEIKNDGRIEELEKRLTDLIKKDFKIYVTNGIN